MARTSVASAALMLFFSCLRCDQCGSSAATNVTPAPARKPRKVQSCCERNASDTRLSMFMRFSQKGCERIRWAQPFTSAILECQNRVLHLASAARAQFSYKGYFIEKNRPLIL